MIPIRTQIVYSAVDFATPRQVAIGLGWDRPRFALSVDLTWNQWSTIVPNTARIDEELTDVQIGLLDLNAQVLNARQTDSLDFRDTLEIRVGGEWRPNSLPLQGKVGGRFRELGLILRAGYSYEPSFVPEQTALTNFLDNPTHVVGLGVGLWTRVPFEMLEGPISFDLFGQVHVLQDRVHVKDPTILEDPELLPTGWPLLGEVRSGGVVIVAGGGLHLSI